MLVLCHAQWPSDVIDDAVVQEPNVVAELVINERRYEFLAIYREEYRIQLTLRRPAKGALCPRHVVCAETVVEGCILAISAT